MRCEGWEGLLNGHIAEARASSFSWGERDCALWCSDWVLKATGLDHGEKWRGKYRTEAGAAKLMLKRGFFGVAEIAAASLPEVPVTHARRGDIVLNADGCLGICNGRLSHFVTGSGVAAIKTLDCKRAWKVE